jgi:hypothetical protein
VRVQFQAMQRAQAQLCATLAMVDNDGLAGAHGFGRVSSWLKELTHVSDHQAAALLRRATAFHPHPDGSNVIPPLAPLTAAAAAAGELSDANIDAIIDMLGQIPAGHHDTAEPHLLDMARQGDAAQVRTAGQRILDLLSPDGPEPDDKPLRDPERSCRLHKKRNGDWHLEADVDSMSGEFMDSVIEALSKRRTGDDGPDTRSPAQRRGDALVDVFSMAMNSPELPTQAGERVHVTVILPFETLRAQMGKATLNLEEQISAWEARLWACDSTVIPCCLRENGEVLDVGRAKRLITPGQRRALYLRDRGCCFPGCTRPPRNSQGHHIIHWDDGGPTNLANLVLLCEHHHRVVHRAGWDIKLAPDGIPEFLPPAFIDPLRKPRRNNMHPPIAS